jgi:hypothetical protein
MMRDDVVAVAEVEPVHGVSAVLPDQAAQLAPDRARGRTAACAARTWRVAAPAHAAVAGIRWL